MKGSNHRCEPGRLTIDPECDWHSEHYWCEACAGWYGVPHTLNSCHTMQFVIEDRSQVPAHTWCACRWCETVRINGREAAADVFSWHILTPEPKR